MEQRGNTPLTSPLILVPFQLQTSLLTFLLTFRNPNKVKIPALYFITTSTTQGLWGLKPIPAVIGPKAGYTVDKLPVYHSQLVQTTTYTYIHCYENLQLSINLTHKSMGRSWNTRECVHREAPSQTGMGIDLWNFLTVHEINLK